MGGAVDIRPITMPTTVECCLANVTPALRGLARECDLQIREVPCLEHCDRCRTGPFLIVDGQLYTGSSHREILRRIDPDSLIESIPSETGSQEAGGR